MKQFEVRRDDLSTFRFTEQVTPEIEDGETLAEVERFAFTANNISYAVVGEKLGYWNFFPVEEGWGVIPVWGFARVTKSKHPEVNVGERLYGYWPMATHLVMQPGRLRSDQLRDMSAHRAELPAVYNSYARASGEAHYDPSMDDERPVRFPGGQRVFWRHAGHRSQRVVENGDWPGLCLAGRPGRATLCRHYVRYKPGARQCDRVV
jgi:hypothetical protein